MRYPLLALVLCACAPTTSGSDQVKDINVAWITSADESLDDNSAPEADDIIEDFMSDQGITGCALGLVVDGNVVYLKGYGEADDVANVPYDVGTMSPVGSISKTLTALGIVSLFNQTEIDNDPAEMYLGGNSPIGDNTIHALLTHQSGAGGDDKAEAFSPLFSAGPHDPEDLAHPLEAYDAYASDTLDYDLSMGSTAYSNVGYSILGALLDLVPGGYEEYIWSTVGRGTNLSVGSPTLALVHSWRETDIPNLAQGYSTAGAELDPWDTTGPIEGWEGPSGGWVMTIGDLARIVASIQRREILSGDEWTEVLTPHANVLGDNFGSAYGYGMWVDEIAGWGNDSKRLTHGGLIGGHAALWVSYEDPDEVPLGVALQCNVGSLAGFDAAADDLFVAHVLDGIPIELPFVWGTPVGASAVRGKTYRIDASAGSADPFGIPASYLSSALQLSVGTRTSSSTIDITLSSVVKGAIPSTVWTGASFATDPVAVTGPRDVLLPSTAGQIKLERTTLRANFGRSGNSIDAMTLTGFVDARTIPTVWTLGRDVCVDARLAGAPCGACADGVLKCAPVTISGWTGSR